jgi:arabinan endo-1,5-alpha-L-arabinosidase
VDQGLVVRSTPEDDWNAIDANLAVDERGTPWLVWGSFWGGIKMRRVDPETGKLSSRDPTLHSLASRRPLSPPAVEAPFIVRKGKHFYLLVSFDMCCRGKTAPTRRWWDARRGSPGRYIDKDGRSISGRPTLQIATMVCEDGWPRVGQPR